MAVVFPREGQGFRAEIQIGGDIHLVLIAAHTGAGPVATIYDAIRSKWFPEREWAEDIEDAKRKAENRARRWYTAVGRKEPFPTVEWKATG